MKSLTTLLASLITECGEYCAVDTTKDIANVLRRVEHEGYPFLTDVLPTIAAGLERGLANGKASPALFTGFQCRGELPQLLGGFFDLVFDRVSGLERDDASPEAIRSIRQISLFVKKIELPASKEAEKKAFSAYVASDKEVGEWEQGVTPEALLEFHQVASALFSREFLPAEHAVKAWQLVPAHGSGSVAEQGVVGNYKFDFSTWTHRLEHVLPYWRYATTRGYSSEKYDRVTFLEPGDETPVRVISVPKTPASPRIIAMEPQCMQYAQQALRDVMDRCIANSYLRMLISTEDQTPNQVLAREGSLSGSFATLDLSEASDRVSNLLAKTLFAGLPHLGDAIQASRSLRAEVPGHGIVSLNRFASMGSGLCFTIETLVFMTIVAIGMRRSLKIPISRVRSMLRKYVGKVRIYGDDIVVPNDMADSVRAALTLYGLKVNNHKSFWTGKFRESCGKEYYGGEDVTLARLRRPLPSSRNQVPEMISAVKLRNNLYQRGLWKTAACLDELITSMIPFPVVAETSPVLGRISCLGIPDYPLSGSLQQPLVMGAVVKERRRHTPIDGDAALLKVFGMRGFGDDRPQEATPIQRIPSILVHEDDHLQYSGRPIASAIHYRRGPAY